MSLIGRYAPYMRTVTVFSGNHALSNGTLTVATPRMWGTVSFTAIQSGPDGQAALFMPRIFSSKGERVRNSASNWQNTGANNGGDYTYLTG